MSKRFFFGLILITALAGSCRDDGQATTTPTQPLEELKVMSYNILYTTSNEATLKVLQESGAHIIGLQEASPTRTRELATQLKYYAYNFRKAAGNMSDQDTGILSKFPITRFFENGVVVQLAPGFEAGIFSIHLSPYPYEPYDFRDGHIHTAEQAVASAASVRLPQINPVLAEIKKLQDEGIPIFLVGDFNEPSHLDWNEQTAAKNMHFGKVVSWPVSNAVANRSLIDAFREKYPDAVKFPGNTWTTWEAADEVYDRIDIIYHSQDARIALKDIKLVGGPQDAAGLTIEGYPSDHYGVLAYYKIN